MPDELTPQWTGLYDTLQEIMYDIESNCDNLWLDKHGIPRFKDCLDKLHDKFGELEFRGDEFKNKSNNLAEEIDVKDKIIQSLESTLLERDATIKSLEKELEDLKVCHVDDVYIYEQLTLEFEALKKQLNERKD